MTIEVKKASELSLGANYYLKALGYGRSGVGKTQILRTLPGKKFVIDTDGGELTNKGIADIDYVTIPMQYANSSDGWNMYVEAKNYFISHKANYRSAVLDSITTLAEDALSDVLKRNNHQTATLPDYNLEKEAVEKEIKWWLVQGVHLYVVAHEEIIRDELTGQVWYRPSARGKLADNLPKWFDEVYHFRAVGKNPTRYMMLVRSDITYTCKSRMAQDPKIEAEHNQDFGEFAKKCGVDLK